MRYPLMSLVLSALIFSPNLHAEELKVDVTLLISAEEPLRSEVESCVNSSLGSIAEVQLVPHSPDLLIRIGALDLGDQVVVSAVVSRFYPPITTFAMLTRGVGIRISDEQWDAVNWYIGREDVVDFELRTFARAELESVCSEIASSFESKTLQQFVEEKTIVAGRILSMGD